ncbi:MAG: serine hydrolase domain-containing protein, partial [Phenylobacterium sp.]
DLISGKDRRLTFGEAMEIARRMGASGPPGAGARAAYSDTNYQILGKVIETLDGAEFHTAFERRIVRPLGLSSTWIYSDPDDRRPRLLRYREAELAIPQAMTFAQADGGVVTTAREGLSFVRAFFEGRLFNSARLSPLQDFRPMFFPLEYGTGMMRFQLPGAMTGLQKLPPLIGHSGLSGAILFHAPARGLSFAGTVNQVDRRSTVFQLLARAVMTVSREA